MKKKLFIIAIIAATVSSAFAASFWNGSSIIDKVIIGKPMMTKDKSKTPEEEAACFKLPEGFVAELVASEEHGIVNPIDIAFDDAGRLWTQTARMYPLDVAGDLKWKELVNFVNDPEAQKRHPNYQRIFKLYSGETKGQDKILIIEDPSAAPKKATVWADGLTIPQSILPYKNGAYVAQGSEIFFLADTNKDNKADKRIPLFKGFGFTDTHTMAHTLVRGPGKWMHFSHGALNKGEVTSVKSGHKVRVDYSKIVRFSLDGKKMDIVSAGLNNIWGFQLRHNGQWYGTEANDGGLSVTPMEEGTAFRGIGLDRIRSYQPWFPRNLHKFRVGGTGISGLAFADDTAGSFPKEWKDVAFLANPITNSINCVKITRNPNGTVTAKHILPDFLKSSDKWFRPVHLEFGPDGCLYVADWYNKIISHNELSRNHPDRDKSHGRIWRIRHVSQKPRKMVNFYKLPNNQLVKYLSSDSLWEKRAAWHQIADRQAKELAPALITILNDAKKDEITRIHALWSLEGLGTYDEKTMKGLLASPLGDLRREAVRALSNMPITPAKLASLLKDFIKDKNVMVRSQVLRTLTDFGKADHNVIDILVSYCRPPFKSSNLGGDYERSFERYLARKALEQYPFELQKYLASDQAKKYPDTHTQWASQAFATAQQRMAHFKSQWTKIKDQRISEETFLVIVGLLKNKEIYDSVAPAFEKTSEAMHLVKLANKHYVEIFSIEVRTILTKAVTYLLQQENDQSSRAGLQAILNFDIRGLDKHILKILNTPGTKADILSTGIQIMARFTRSAKTTYLKLLANPKIPFSDKKVILTSFGGYDNKLAQEKLEELLPSLNADEKLAIIKSFTYKAQAIPVLINLLAKGVLKNKDFTLEMAETIANVHEGPQTKSLLNYQREEEAKRKKNLKKKLHKFMAIAKKRGGNPKMGKPLFDALCLSCHSVAGKGAGFAPELDGSSNREDEALLTAILDPSAAVENSYYAFWVKKKDGTTVEGFKEKDDQNGVTLRFMGGGKLFIPKAEIKAQGSTGRSVMPANLIDNLPEDQLANLLAYIRSLK